MFDLRDILKIGKVVSELHPSASLKIKKSGCIESCWSSSMLTIEIMDMEIDVEIEGDKNEKLCIGQRKVDELYWKERRFESISTALAILTYDLDQLCTAT